MDAAEAEGAKAHLFQRQIRREGEIAEPAQVAAGVNVLPGLQVARVVDLEECQRADIHVAFAEFGRVAQAHLAAFERAEVIAAASREEGAAAVARAVVRIEVNRRAIAAAVHGAITTDHAVEGDALAGIRLDREITGEGRATLDPEAVVVSSDKVHIRRAQRAAHLE